MTNLFKNLDKLLMALFALGAIGIVLFVYRDRLLGERPPPHDGAMQAVDQ